MLRFEKGDLLDSKYKIFCHQVNCMHVMGSGIAKQIREKYPEVYEKYMQMTRQNLGMILPVFTHDDRICINMFAQHKYGRDKQYTDYTAFEECLTKIKAFLEEYNIKKDNPVAFPYKIGCGLAGGDWNIVKEMLMKFSDKIEQDVIIVEL